MKSINFNYAKFIVFSSGFSVSLVFYFPTCPFWFISLQVLSVSPNEASYGMSAGTIRWRTNSDRCVRTVFKCLQWANPKNSNTNSVIIVRNKRHYTVSSLLFSQHTSIQKSIAQNGLPQSLFLLFLIFKKVYEHIKVFYNIAIFNTLQRKDFLWNFSVTWPLDLHP